MPDPFASLIPDARRFLGELFENNSRDWFAGQKSRYDADLKIPATLLLDQIAQDVGRATGATLTPKLFRAHRDVRFSKDKTPYHTHLHLLWATGPTRATPRRCFLVSHRNRSRPAAASWDLINPG